MLEIAKAKESPIFSPAKSPVTREDLKKIAELVPQRPVGKVTSSAADFLED